MPEKMVFVDVETTGTRVTTDRVIEIGIIRIEDGKVTQKYQSLFDPGGYVSPYIEQFTGITRSELDHAPSFAEKADEIYEILDGCVFVAHNVRFDYGFIKNEFSRVDLPFSPTHFCTVRLSRQLFPQINRYNLSTLIDHFGISCPNRHRALDDALATYELFCRAQAISDAEVFESAIRKSLKQSSQPINLPTHLTTELPNSPGVYIFYGDKDYPLYIGKSKAIRQRVLSHFTSDHSSSREMHLCQQVKHIEAKSTAGELGALLLESSLVKSEQPLYNRKLRHSRQVVIARHRINDSGYAEAEIETVDAITVADLPSIIGVYKSNKQAKASFESIAKENNLCHKLLGLEHTRAACFPHQLGWCKGACVKKEPCAIYNLRFDLAFQRFKFKRWPFEGPIGIRERNEEGHEDLFIIDMWCLIGTYHTNAEGETWYEVNQNNFDIDTYSILVRFIENNPKLIQSIPPQFQYSFEAA